MTTRRLLWRNLRFHWRGNLAVVLGVAVATAVLTGALLVGDSLRGSLRERADEQRAGIDYLLVSPRFIAAPKSQNNSRTLDGAILLQGSLRSANDDARNVSGVTIIGINSVENFAHKYGLASASAAIRSSWLDLGLQSAAYANKPVPQWADDATLKNGVLLSEETAHGLAAESMPITIRLSRIETIPRESILGRRDSEQTSLSLTLPVGRIVSDGSVLAQFRPIPGPGPTRNVFVYLPALQEAINAKGRGNALFAKGGNLADYQRDLPNLISLEDWGIRVEAPGRYLSVESTESILSPAVAGAVDRAAKRMNLTAAPTLVYLANSISQDKQSIPYSVVAALDPSAPPPLGPFLPEGVTSLADNEIILADWRDSPLKDVPVGSTITLNFFEPELADGQLREKQAEFKLKGRVPLEIDRPAPEPRAMRTAAADPHLTPGFPGITDRLSIRDWNPPFPFDNKRIQKRDENFWQKHKATPKAYVTLAAGQKLWASRYGKLTSIRLAVPGEDSDKVNWEERTKEFKKVLHEELRPEEGGFIWQDLRARADAASEGGQDYGMLFLSFSFFLIVSALMLTGLLVQLNLQRRASEIGLLLATGWSRMRVLLLLLVEILLLVLIGSVFGLLLAVAFGQGMLALMARLWPDASAGSFLHFHAAGVSLAIGFFATLLIGSLTIVWGLFFLFRVSPSALLAGLTTPTRDFIASQNPLPLPPLRGERAGVRGVSNSQLSGSTPSPPSPLPRSGGEGSTRRAIESSERRWHLKPILIAFGLIFGLASLAAGVFLRNPMFQALTFFTGGALLLTSFLLLLHTWLKRDRTSHPFGHGLSALFQLGTRNAQRHPTRSLLTAGLLASAAFLLVAVESFRREPARDFLKKSGGSGGMPVFIQTDLPVYKDLNTDGREDVLDAVRIHYQRQKDSESVEQRAEEARKTLEQVTIYSCRVKPGDDVSCLNLYQATRPQMLGVPESLIHRGGFKFLSSEAENSKEKNNPWLLLDHTQEDRAIPVIGEENTITWMLKKDLGEEIEITDDSGNPVRLRIVAILKDSVFQSGLLLSSRNFQRLFPRQEGFTLHLIEGSPEQANAAAELLRVGLAKQGPEVVQSRERVATFMAVENTYLTTFQLLGGLGLLLGSLGLAVVLLRNVWERRGELALLRALGYRHSDLGELILAENSLLLLAGLAIGTTAAILSVLPHLIQEGALPSPRPLLMLAAVLVAGLLAGSFAMISALRAPLIPALRKE